MRKSVRLSTVLALAALALCCVLFFAACKDKKGEQTERESACTIEVPADFRLKASDTSCDFMAGVSGKKGEESAEVTADASSVQFGVPGRYSVVYTCGEESETVPVYVYGDPFLADAAGNRISSAPDAVITYADARSGAAGGLLALDTFGERLPVRTETAVIDGYGKVAYGTQTSVSYTATDAAGNTLSFSRKVTISDEGRPDYTEEIASMTAAKAFDMSSWNMRLPLAAGNALVFVLEGEGEGVEDVTPYATVRGVTDEIVFDGSWFAGGGTGARSLDIVTTDGWFGIEFEVTDTSAPLVHFDGGDVKKGIDGAILPAADVVLPRPYNGGYSTLPVTYTARLFTGNDLSRAVDEVSAPGPYLYRVTAESANGVTVTEQQFYATGAHDLLSEIAATGGTEYVKTDDGAYALKILQLSPYNYTLSPEFVRWAAQNYTGFSLSAWSEGGASADGFMKLYGAAQDEPGNYAPGSTGVHYDAPHTLTFGFSATDIPGFNGADAVNVRFNGKQSKYLRGAVMTPVPDENNPFAVAGAGYVGDYAGKQGVYVLPNGGSLSVSGDYFAALKTDYRGFTFRLYTPSYAANPDADVVLAVYGNAVNHASWWTAYCFRVNGSRDGWTEFTFYFDNADAGVGESDALIFLTTGDALEGYIADVQLIPAA